MKTAKRIALAIAVVLLVGVAAFTIWAYTPLGPMPEALAALKSDSQIQVETKPWLTFRPIGVEPATGFIIYPGGRVDPRSYAPTAREIACQGYLVTIVPMPFNLAVFGVGKAGDIMAAHPEIQRWAIGGHSLGGAMAATYVYNDAGKADALVLWASYPANNNSLRDRDVAVTSISGTNDGLATPAKIDASRLLLPEDTTWVAIKGGNHAQFGWYGQQPGDGEATISREAQQEQIVQATEDVLQNTAKEVR